MLNKLFNSLDIDNETKLITSPITKKIIDNYNKIYNNKYLKFPSFDNSFKNYLEKSDLSFWVIDVVRFKRVWCNDNALSIFKKKSVEDFLDNDMSKCSLKILLTLQNNFKEIQNKNFNIVPFTIYPDDAECPLKLMIKYQGVYVNDELCLLGSCSSIIKDLNQSQISNNYRNIAVAHEAFLYTPAIMLILSLDGKLIYKNTAATDHFYSIIPEKNKDINYLQYIFQGIENSKVDVTNVLNVVNDGKTFSSHIRQPPYDNEDILDDIWHTITVSRQQDTSTGKFIYLITQIDITELKRKDLLLLHDVKDKYNQEKVKIVNQIKEQIIKPLIESTDLCDIIYNASQKKLIHTKSQKLLLNDINKLNVTQFNILDTFNNLLHSTIDIQDNKIRCNSLDEYQINKYSEIKKFNFIELLQEIINHYSYPYTTNKLNLQYDLEKNNYIINNNRNGLKRVFELLLYSILQINDNKIIDINFTYNSKIIYITINNYKEIKKIDMIEYNLNKYNINMLIEDENISMSLLIE